MAKDLDGHVEEFRTRRWTTPARSPSWLPTRWCSRSARAAASSAVHALVATGINADGHREILGLHVTTSEDGAGWLGFFRDLVARGLAGVKLVTSDAHAGLVAAIGATLRRCSLAAVPHPLRSQPDVDHPEELAGAGSRRCCTRSTTSPTPRRSTPSSTGSSTPWPRSSPPSPSTSNKPAPTSSPSPRSPRRSGARSGPTTPTSASTARSAAAPTSSASSPTEARSSASSAPSSPNSTTNGPKAAATSDSTSSPAPKPSPTSLTRRPATTRHCQPSPPRTTSGGSPAIHHATGLDPCDRCKALHAA